MAKRERIDVKYVLQLQNGDIDALGYIYDFYRNSIYYFSLSLVKNTVDAEEIVQDTFIQVLNNIKSLQKPEAFHSWLHKIAYHNTLHFLRKRKRDSPTIEEIDFENIVEAKPRDEPSAMSKEKEVLDTVRSEIERMSPKLVGVAKLRYFDDLTTREISEILEVPEGTVKTRLLKVRETIQPVLKAKGFKPSKYFAFTPFAYQVFQELVHTNEMTPEVSSQIYKTLTVEMQPIVSAVGATAMGVASKFKIPTIVQGLLATTVLTTSGVVTYQIMNPPVSVIEQVSYYKEITNKDVEVGVVLQGKYDKSEIQVLNGSEVMDYQLSEDRIIFTVMENNLYTVKVSGETVAVDIKNIDKKAPSLQAASETESSLKLTLSDDLIGVDFEKSYIEFEGKKHTISKEGEVQGIFTGEVIVFLYDKIDNFAEYTIDIG